MPAITLPRPPAAIVWPIQMESAEPQGTEDKQLRQTAEAALQHYHRRTEYILAQTAADDYGSVPFEPVRKVRVVYKHAGELKPLRYPLDE